MPKTYIIGHQKPDTDSVVGAIALEFLYKNNACFGYKNLIAVISGPLNPETKFLFKKFNITPPPIITSADIKTNDQVVLVDHNDSSQRIENLNPNQIVEIVDHHKANINFNTPIYLNFKTWGSSNTIIYHMMQQNPKKSITPDKNLANLMLAAILSDTVGFKSATTTNRDKEIGQELSKIAGISNIDKFTLEIFKAKSNINDLSNQEIVKNDYKLFNFAQKTFIGQVETVEQEAILKNRKTELLTAMQKVKQSEKVELLFLAITDILKVNTKLLILGDAEQKVAETAFNTKTKDNVIDIGPKLSRKKEIAPAIEQAI